MIAVRSSVPYWTPHRLARAQEILLARVSALRDDIARELRKYDDERLTLIADNVPDLAELSTADLIGDVYLAEVDRDVRELRDVESALQRITAGTYGDCVDCGQPIDPMRLGFNPHAARCLHCQEGAERAPGHERRLSSNL